MQVTYISTWRNLKFASRGSPAPTHVQQITSALWEISLSVARLSALYFFSSLLESSPETWLNKIIVIFVRQYFLNLGYQSDYFLRLISFWAQIKPRPCSSFSCCNLWSSLLSDVSRCRTCRSQSHSDDVHHWFKRKNKLKWPRYGKKIGDEM